MIKAWTDEAWEDFEYCIRQNAFGHGRARSCDVRKHVPNSLRKTNLPIVSHNSPHPATRPHGAGTGSGKMGRKGATRVRRRAGPWDRERGQLTKQTLLAPWRRLSRTMGRSERYTCSPSTTKWYSWRPFGSGMAQV